jgi:general secretion pathway protein D
VRSIQRPDLIEAEFDSGTESDIGGMPLRLRHAAPTAASDEKPTPQPTAASAAASAAVGAEKPVAVPNEKPNGAGVDTAPGEGAAPATPAEPEAKAAGTLPLAELSWRAPNEVRAGEQFSVVLDVSSEAPMKGMPLLVSFDPSVLQLASVREGSFFKQGGVKTSFSQRVDAARGKTFISLVPAGRNA